MRKKLGNYLKKRRKQVGLSQKQVADEFGYQSSQFISNMERGLCDPPVSILKRLAKLYKISAHDLLEMLISSVNERIRDEFRKSTVNSGPARARHS